MEPPVERECGAKSFRDRSFADLLRLKISVLLEQRFQTRLAIGQPRAADRTSEGDPIYFGDPVQDRDGRAVPEQDALGVNHYGINQLLTGREFRQAHLHSSATLEPAYARPLQLNVTAQTVNIC